MEKYGVWHGSFSSYVIGLISSLFLTCLSFYLVMTNALSHQNLIFTIIALALTQALIQLFFFLHLGKEGRPSWGRDAFYFMIVVLLTLVLLTFWIMYDLGIRVMSHMEGM